MKRIWTRPLIAALALLASGMAAQAAGWLMIGPDEAHLRIAPSAFGTQDINRWVLTNDTARYERWLLPIDPSRRFFQIVLREANGNAAIRDDLDLTHFVQESWPGDENTLVWGGKEQMSGPLGGTTVQYFSKNKIGCAAFVAISNDYVGEFPRNVTKGLYCDPSVAAISPVDARDTVMAISYSAKFGS